MVTKHANNLINYHYPTYMKIFSIYETVNHDGYDEDGPKSYLYDLYIYCEYDGEKFVDKWSWEEWFSSNERIGYIETNNMNQYDLETFLSNSYFLEEIFPYLLKKNK
jgi:hypothetical protein